MPIDYTRLCSPPGLSEFRAGHPEVRWAAIVGMRHRVVHDYLHVDLDLVWNVVGRDVQPLVECLDRIVAE